MYDYPVVLESNNDDTQDLSQEYAAPTYHEMQTAPFGQVLSSTISIDRHDPAFTLIQNPRLNANDSTNRTLSSASPVTANHSHSYVSTRLTEESHCKRRRTIGASSGAPLTAPLPRRRFDPSIQQTAASQMLNLSHDSTQSNIRVASTNSKSMSESTQYVLNQTMKPLFKLCEETNKLIKESLKQSTEQTKLISELVAFPSELQKLTQQLSHVLHMQAKVLQTREEDNDDGLITELNGVDLKNVERGASLNATARTLLRVAYGDSASFNDLAPGDFDVLLGVLGVIHKQHPASIYANSQSIKNSLQQMKHDFKKTSSLKSLIGFSSRRKSTTDGHSSNRTDADNEGQQ